MYGNRYDGDQEIGEIAAIGLESNLRISQRDNERVMIRWIISKVLHIFWPGSLKPLSDKLKIIIQTSKHLFPPIHQYKNKHTPILLAA